MALRLFTGSTTTSAADAITAVSNDTILIVSGAVVAATGPGNNGISGSGIFNVSIEVNGTLAGASNGIFMNGWLGSNTVTVGTSGRIINEDQNAIFLDGTDAVLVNHGSITGYANTGSALVFFSSDRAYTFNSGTITSSQGNANTLNYAGAASPLGNALINIGTIISTSGQDDGTPNVAFLGNNTASDLVTNSGTITGNILMLGGADAYDGRGGRVVGTVDGGAGNDTLFGGIGADRMDGGADNDTLFFDAEDQTFGSVTGGTGYDTGTNIGGTMTLNMTATSLEAFFGSAADEFIIAGSLGGFGAFVRSGDGNDLFDGSAQADNVDGGAGVDVLYGRGGADILAGGLGGDWMQGGVGADVFDYNAGTDSTVNGQDFIADFSTAEGDKINLDDALTNLGFATATFNTGFGTNASVYVFAQGGASLVQVYTGATLQMQLVVSQGSLTVGDFVL